MLACLAGFGAAAPAQAAPVLAPLEPCYASTSELVRSMLDPEPVVVTGSGFAPGSLVDVAVNGIEQANGVPVDGAGNLTTTIMPPLVTRYRMPFTVTAAPRDAVPDAATVRSFVSNVTARVTPSAERTRRRARFVGRGFVDGDRPIYAHYVLRGKLRRTVVLARSPHGPCGSLNVRRKQFPFRPDRGPWRIQVDQSRRLRTDVRAGTINVFVKTSST